MGSLSEYLFNCQMDFFSKNQTQSSSSSSSSSAPPPPPPPSSVANKVADAPVAQPGQESMLLTQALVELKTLDKRIQKLISESVFVSLKGELKRPDPRVAKAKSNHDRVRDLMNRRIRLKSAIVMSNAMTQVRVAGMDMTVAQAIETKTSIKNYKSLLGQMKAQYGTAVQQMEYDNQRVRTSLESTLKKTNDDGKDQVDVEEYSRSYMKMHGVELFDPINVQAKIEDLEKFITDFEDNVDVVLSVKNATTTINF